MEHYPQRKSLRLPGRDYARSAVYFVTICARNNACVLGQISNGAVLLGPFGQIAQDAWNALPERYPGVRIPEHVIMPNHVHGIIEIVGPWVARASIDRVPGSHPPVALGRVIAYWKYETTKRINQMLGTPGTAFWQRNYFERVIRDEHEYTRIRDYIAGNPSRWSADRDGGPEVGAR